MEAKKMEKNMICIGGIAKVKDIKQYGLIEATMRYKKNE
jgi:hypothetical protein